MNLIFAYFLKTFLFSDIRLVLEGGVEPPLTAPKAAVLPLDDPRIMIA